jgi:hypothetical protein
LNVIRLTGPRTGFCVVLGDHCEGDEEIPEIKTEGFK